MVPQDPLLDQWKTFEARLAELNLALAQPNIDQRQRLVLQKEHAFLSGVVEKHAQQLALDNEFLQVTAQKERETDVDLRSLYEEELHEIERKQARVANDITQLLFPPDPLDTHDVYIEIRAGAGGQEAALFAADLAGMYIGYAARRGWQASIIDTHATDLKGFKDVTVSIEGKGAYGALKFEFGTHRVQRVPATETSGRIHTSTATVAVFPSITHAEETAIDPSQLRIDVFRAGGAGGQHVNKTESAVRITHLPTNIVVTCQDERSQHKNKAKAMKVLQARLASAKREQEESKRSKDRKQMVGTGMRAEKVRTYNFHQNRVTDHQVDVTLQKLDMVMAGDMDEIILALQEKERQDRRKQPLQLPV